jgi:hypothetical protein
MLLYDLGFIVFFLIRLPWIFLFVIFIFKINFIIELNRIDLLNTCGYSLHFVLFNLLFKDVALASHVTSSYVVIQNVAVKFELSQQAPFVMGGVHNGVMVGFQRSFFSFPFGYNIDDSFILVDSC